jgi:hypothetical protein
MIPASTLFDQSTIAALLEHDPVVTDVRAFFARLDWSIVQRWEARQSLRGRPSHPESAYLKAFLLRIREGFIYTSQLRAFLVKHPLLVIELGFCLALDPTQPYGFDVEHTLPTRFWLGEKLRFLDRELLTDLLASTVHALQEEIPGLGEVVSFDVKHIYAWVQENNKRAYVNDRYDKTKCLAGDPDCRLGVKRSTNQERIENAASHSPSSLTNQDQAPSPEKKDKKEKKELLWGYGSGIAAATIPDYGDVVIAEWTQPFNKNDVTSFRPLYQHASLALQHFPTHIAADAAYDAWYVYDVAARHNGIAAVPLRQSCKTPFDRLADGTPRCPIGLPMHPSMQFQHTSGFLAQRFQCPLLFPEATGQHCAHEQFVKGKGCVKDLNWEPGGIQRVTLDRNSPLFHSVYTQRTACERINSQAKELGIERPRVRNGRSVANLNTLTYLIINVRALQRAQSINQGLLSIRKGIR